MANYYGIVPGPYNNNYIIPRLGSFNLSMRLAPFQPSKVSPKLGPRFFGYDAVGSYFGLNGYYSNIPCWRPIFGHFFVPYQASTFNITEAGLHSADALLPNPFTYNIALGQSGDIPIGGSLGFAYTPGANITVANNPPTVSMGLGKLHLGQTHYAASPNYGTQNDVAVPWPSILFQNETLSFPTSFIPEFADLGEHFCSNPFPPASSGTINSAVSSGLYYDIAGFKYIHGYTSITDYFPCGSSRLIYNAGQFMMKYVSGGGLSPDTQNPLAPYATPILVNRGDTNQYAVLAPPTGTLAASVKTSPNGNFICGGWGASGYGPPTSSTGVFIGNVFARYDISSGTSGIFHTNWSAKAVLSDTTDNADFSASTTVFQQIPGGGFLAWNGSIFSGYAYLVLPDFSGYFRIGIYGLPKGSGINPEFMSVDGDGILYMLNYTGQVFTNMYWSGPPKNYISIPLPTLTQIGVSCDKFTLNPWAG